MVETCFSASLHVENFITKIPKSLFLVVFQIFGFGQILGNFGQIWAEFVALAMADRMPKDHLKS
jgi:hypothetical protein